MMVILTRLWCVFLRHCHEISPVHQPGDWGQEEDEDCQEELEGEEETVTVTSPGSHYC